MGRGSQFRFPARDHNFQQCSMLNYLSTPRTCLCTDASFRVEYYSNKLHSKHDTEQLLQQAKALQKYYCTINTSSNQHRLLKRSTSREGITSASTVDESVSTPSSVNVWAIVDAVVGIALLVIVIIIVLKQYKARNKEKPLYISAPQPNNFQNIQRTNELRRMPERVKNELRNIASSFDLTTSSAETVVVDSYYNFHRKYNVGGSTKSTKSAKSTKTAASTTVTTSTANYLSTPGPSSSSPPLTPTLSTTTLIQQQQQQTPLNEPPLPTTTTSKKIRKGTQSAEVQDLVNNSPFVSLAVDKLLSMEDESIQDMGIEYLLLLKNSNIAEMFCKIPNDDKAMMFLRAMMEYKK